MHEVAQKGAILQGRWVAGNGGGTRRWMDRPVAGVVGTGWMGGRGRHGWGDGVTWPLVGRPRGPTRHIYYEAALAIRHCLIYRRDPARLPAVSNKLARHWKFTFVMVQCRLDTPVLAGRAAWGTEPSFPHTGRHCRFHLATVNCRDAGDGFFSASLPPLPLLAPSTPTPDLGWQHGETGSPRPHCLVAAAHPETACFFW